MLCQVAFWERDPKRPKFDHFLGKASEHAKTGAAAVGGGVGGGVGDRASDDAESNVDAHAKAPTHPSTTPRKSAKVIGWLRVNRWRAVGANRRPHPLTAFAMAGDVAELHSLHDSARWPG